MITSVKRTRRRILQGGLVAAAAAATWHPSVLGGLLRSPPAVAQSLPQLPARIGAGKSVAIIGAGIAGLTTAYELLRGGFDVTVFEAESRYGGRSLTVRPSDPDYKAWAIDRYPNLTEFTYVDTIPAEVRGAKVPAQTARFHPHRIGDGYFDMHFNAGPGRIPTIHTGILHYCRQFGVEMAPYLFVSEGNLLQSATLNGGKPVQVRQFLYDMLGHISELLYVHAGEALTRAQARNARALETQLKSFLVSLGDLSPGGRFAGSSRAGYAVVPGAGTNSGILAPQLSLDEMLAEGSIWADVMDSAHIDWQLPLLEPVGGMDMIWQAFLAETVGGAPLHTRIKLNHNVIGLTRDGTTTGPIDVTTRGPAGEAKAAFDYVVMTGVPILMRDMDLTNVAGEALYDDVSSLLISGGFKYGWQARTRFWEAPDTGIFGGISFTGHMIKQIWYPSNGYNGPTGILTGAYVFDEVLYDANGRFWLPDENDVVPIAEDDAPEQDHRAWLWAHMSQDKRTALAIEGGETLHPGFAQKVYADRGLSISWDNQPFQRGLCLWDTFTGRPDVYARLIQPLDADGRLYVAGDTMSYWAGWQEGAVRSAWWTLAKLREHVLSHP